MPLAASRLNSRHEPPLAQNRPAARPGDDRLGPEERALLKRLRIELVLSLLLITGGAWLHSPAAALTAFIVCLVQLLNFFLLERGLRVILFTATRGQILKGILGILGHLVLLAGAVFAMIRASRLDPLGLAAGSMEIVLAGFMEVFYIIGREIKQRCLTRRS